MKVNATMLGIAVCCSVLQCVAVCCSVFQRVAVWCSVLQFGSSPSCTRNETGTIERNVVIITTFKKKNPKKVFETVTIERNVVMITTAGISNRVCCSGLQCVAACCSVQQCVTTAGVSNRGSSRERNGYYELKLESTREKIRANTASSKSTTPCLIK